MRKRKHRPVKDDVKYCELCGVCDGRCRSRAHLERVREDVLRRAIWRSA